MSLSHRVFAAVLVAPLVVGLGQAARAETIFGAMAKAYKNNPDLNAARAGLRATDEGVPIARAGIMPKLSAGATLSATNLKGNLTPLQRANEQNAQIALTVTQPIFDGFQTLNNVRAAESNVFASREQLRATQINILQAAAQAFVDVARDKEIVTIRRQNLEFLREQVKASNARLNVGEGTRTDVAQSQAQLSAAQALLQSAIAQEKSSEAVYQQIVGDRPVGVHMPSAPSRLLPPSLSRALSVGRAENPSILGAQYNVDASGYQVKSAEGALLPGVSVQGSIYNNSTGVTGSSIQAQINIPLYQGGAASGRVRQQKELLGQARIQVDSARQNVDQQIVTAWTQYKAFQANISANQESIKAAKLALSGVVEERKVGQSTTLDVLNSQQIVLNNQETLVQAQANAVVASYNLLGYMGRLTVKHLGLRVPEYHPEAHYDAVKDKWFGLRTVDGR